MNIEKERKAFELLSKELSKKKITLDIICVGGYALYRSGIRVTQDIDAFYRTTAEIEEIIRKVGDSLGINNADEAWLNNSVENLNENPPKEICETLYSFPNLEVKIAPIDYIACMKLSSGRAQDISDVAKIIRHLGFKDPEDLKTVLSKYGFSVDGSLILEAFGSAYGMEWLEKYYRDHEEELMDLF